MEAAPDGKILKSDVVEAKNYLNHQHVSELNRIVSAYLDLAERTMNSVGWPSVCNNGPAF
jgi:hypothetical protein